MGLSKLIMRISREISEKNKIVVFFYPVSGTKIMIQGRASKRAKLNKDTHLENGFDGLEMVMELLDLKDIINFAMTSHRMRLTLFEQQVPTSWIKETFDLKTRCEYFRATAEEEEMVRDERKQELIDPEMCVPADYPTEFDVGCIEYRSNNQVITFFLLFYVYFYIIYSII